jgi:thioester reductase-like protein
MLLFQPGLDFIAAFLACQRAGTVPVPMALPRAREPQSRLAAVIENCSPALILSHADARPAFVDAALGGSVLETQQIAVDAARSNPPARRTELAFLQYTSGSTGQPKGVRVTHRNVLANVQDIARLFKATPSVRSVSWLPTHHDMGLIGCVLAPLLVGADSTLMAPASFLRDPLSWLQAIAARRAEVSGGPNFAFELCARRLLDERSRPDPKELDLSSWRVAFTGAEPVRASMLMRFAAAAAPYGFRPDSFLPCYGLAEATLCVAGIGGSPGHLIEHFDPDALGRGRAMPLPRGNGTTAVRRAPLVSCGDLPASTSTVIAIVDAGERREVPVGSVGEIWINGPGVAAGYWDQRTDSSEVFGQELPGRPGAFLRTGDLGFIHETKLFITGRLRDLIIINGINYHPEDIEHTIAARMPELANGRAVFAIESEAGVRIVALQELTRVQSRSADADRLSAAICSAVWDGHGIAVQDVVLLAPGALPMTSSGKVQRQRCRELYLAGRIEGRRPLPAQEPPIPAAESSQANDALKLRAILAEVLGLHPDELRLDRPISSFGLDSLKTTQMKMLVESRMAWEIPGEALHGEMTLLDIAHRRGMPEAPDPDTFWTDGVLASALMPPAGSPDLDGDVLITGATGLVGSHMVREVIRRHARTVFCLVRAESDELAQARLTQHLTAVGLSAADLGRCVRAVRGDATLPNLGLSHRSFAELANRVGVVFHNAAKLDFVSSYGGLRSANVSSVRSILEFAALGRPKFLGHTSSVSVLESPLRRERHVAEHAPLDFPESLAIGYAQTKWVADALVLHARARGFATSIFRPSWIVGPAGSTPSGDFLARFLEGCRRIRALPDSHYRWDLVPAKHVARAIVELTWSDAGRQPVYHLGATRQLSIPQLAAGLQRLGMTLDVVPVDEWLARLRAAFAEDPEHPLRAVAGLFLSENSRPPAAESYLRGQTPAMDSRRTWARLRELGIGELSPADELLAALLNIDAQPAAVVPAVAE